MNDDGNGILTSNNTNVQELNRKPIEENEDADELNPLNNRRRHSSSLDTNETNENGLADISNTITNSDSNSNETNASQTPSEKENEGQVQIDGKDSSSSSENAVDGTSNGSRSKTSGGTSRKQRSEQKIYRPKSAIEEEKKALEEQQKQRNDNASKKVQMEEEKKKKVLNGEEVQKNPRNRRRNSEKNGEKNGEKSAEKNPNSKPSESKKERPPRNRGRNRRENDEKRDQLKKKEDSERNSSTLFTMWQSSSSKPDSFRENSGNRRRRQEENVLNQVPTLRDLHSLVFSSNSVFEENEIVMAPRTRGGFSYAKVIKYIPEKNCWFDHHFEHRCNLWRVVYMNNGNPLYKDLPSIYLGRISSNNEENGKEEKKEEEKMGDNFADFNRKIGDRPIRRDLDRVIFSPQQSFNLEEIVLVPRSKGGFTYGKIYRENRSLCPLSTSNPNEAHNLSGWRVAISEPKEGREDREEGIVRKDLISPLIGKIQFITSNDVAKPGKAITMTFEEPPFQPHLGSRKESESIEVFDELNEEDRPRSRTTSSGTDNEILDYDVYADSLEDIDEEEDFMWAPNPISNRLPSAIDSPSSKSEVSPVKDSAFMNPVHNSDLIGTVPLSLQSLTIKNPSNAFPNSFSTPQLNSNLSLNQIGGLIAVDKDELLKSLMNPSTKTSTKIRRHLIVLDGPNVARKHGRDTEVSSEGINLALNYWKEKGHDAICFLPQQYVKRKPSSTLGAFLPTATNIPMLLNLVEKGSVVLTPPQDYDDSYCIDYAMKHDACIVTNDRYWDHVDGQMDKSEKAKRHIKRWLRDHLISFTFARDEFLPNPNFKFPPFVDEMERQ